MWIYTELSYVLSTLYYMKDDVVSIAQRAGLKPEFIPWSNSAITNWTTVLKHAENRNMVENLLDVVLMEHPDNKVILAYKNDLNSIPNITSGYSGDPIFWKGTSLSPVQYEALMAKENTLLPIHFFEMGLEKAKSVARVATEKELGSGFLIANNYFVTNNHVIPSADVARSSNTILRFNFEETVTNANYEEFTLDPDNGFATSPTEEHDWTVVKVKGNPNQKYGALDLKKTTLKKNDYVNIIQHPGGGYKQVALYHNVVTFVDENLVQYLTDTLPGSSGSPVFNSKWEVVALHHSKAWAKEPNTSRDAYRNEGININILVEAIATLG